MRLLLPHIHFLLFASFIGLGTVNTMPVKIDHSPYPCKPQPTMLEDFHTSIKRLVEDLMEDPRTKSLRDEFSAELHLAAIVKRG